MNIRTAKQHRFLYLHSGGVTAALNRTLHTLVHYAGENKSQCFISPQGLLGTLHNQFVELSSSVYSSLSYTPSSFMASVRFSPSDDEIQSILKNLIAHRIDCIFIQGGDDSQKTLLRLHQAITERQLPLQCIGIPKTIDNDLPDIHVSPGYPSAAKYLAVSFMEAAWDMMAMHHTSTKVFVLETMGRDTGWLAASTSVASHRYDLPHLLCLPEHVHTPDDLLDQIRLKIAQSGFCMITIAEGYPFKDVLAEHVDAFGHAQLGAQGPLLARWIEQELRVKVRYARPDCLQRSAGHILSQYDWDLADTLAQAAIDAMVDGNRGIMLGTTSYALHSLNYSPLETIAHKINPVPAAYITHTGYQTTHDFINYIEPLITGEIAIPYVKGLPDYQFPLSKSIAEVVL